MNRLFLLVLAASLGASSSFLYAQEFPPPPEDAPLTDDTPADPDGTAPSWTMDEVTVTATRSRRSASAVPASVSVITRDMIEASAAANPDDLLRGLAGVDVKRVTGFGSGLPSRISLRGVPGANRTLVLMDGIPLNAAGSGFMSVNALPLDITERIELVRGPFSSLYGSNAFGGVVHLLTRDPSGEPFAFAKGGWGGSGYREAGAALSGPLGPVAVLLHADQRSIGNVLVSDHLLDRTWDAASGDWKVTPVPEVNHPYEQERLFGKAVLLPIPEIRVTLHAQSAHDLLGYGRTLFLPEPREVTVENRSTLGSAQVVLFPGGALEVEAGAYTRRRTERLVNESYSHMNPFPPFPIFVPSFTDTRYRDLQGHLSATWRARPSHTITFGGETLLNEGDFDPARHLATGAVVGGRTGNLRSIHNSAFYLQEEASLGERWKIVPGGRVDDSSQAGCVFSPKAGVLFKAAEDLRLRASWGLAFRAPTLAELYMPDVSAIPGMVLTSNPDLKPESIRAIDIGIEKDLSPVVTTGLEAFRNEMQDLISLSRSGATMTYVNVSSARSSGFDATTSWRPSNGTTASVNYTYQWAEDATTGAALDYMPRHKGNAALVFARSLGPWRVGLNLRENVSGTRFYTDSPSGRQVLLKAYACTDAGFRIGWRETAWVHMMVTNVFDAGYEETGEVPAPGRLAVLSAGAGF